MKDKTSKKRRRRWEGQARTIGDESMKKKRKRRRRRTRVSQAVITDIGSAIVGATKAHIVPKQARMNDGREGSREQRKGGEREKERRTLQGQR